MTNTCQHSLTPAAIVLLILLFVTMMILVPPENYRMGTAVQWRRELKVDPKSVVPKTNPKNQRRFVSYSSSEWEHMWLTNGDAWAEQHLICNILWGAHRHFVHEFLNATCSSRYQPPFHGWCVIDDEYRSLWYNTLNTETFELSWENPLPQDARLDPPAPVIPAPHSLDHILSRFVFLDEETGETYVEHIEPLVSHLRFPLAKCIGPLPDLPRYEHYATSFRGFILPPPKIRKNRAMYFDAGATAWDTGPGGVSLKYFYNRWKRHGTEFDEIYAFSALTSRDEFYANIPKSYAAKTYFQQAVLASSPVEDAAVRPFLPRLIKEKSTRQDYVLFKLDVDDFTIEEETILNILEDPDSFIDEIAWEHRIRGNYLMTEWGEPNRLPDISLRQSMEFFLLMRQRGIRAHSWI